MPHHPANPDRHDDDLEFDPEEEILAELLEAGATDHAVLDDFYREIGVDPRRRRA